MKKDPLMGFVFTGARREYIEWNTGAKRPETRFSRLATTLAWVAAGQKRNWKYESC